MYVNPDPILPVLMGLLLLVLAATTAHQDRRQAWFLAM